MPSLRLVLAVLVGTTFGLPSPRPADDPVRTLPKWWGFNITALEGPACSDFGATKGFYTRPTYGSNTVDGSEIYYWHFAYPAFVASVDAATPENSTWCETTLSYAELNEDGSVSETPGYRLKPHKNGTEMIASYELDKGVEATWKFIYYPEGQDEIVDTITIDGPRSTGPTGTDTDHSSFDKVVQWALPECGSGTIKYRTELTVTAKEEGAEGTVSSMQTEAYGEPAFYGAQQGVSYDFEECAA